MRRYSAENIGDLLFVSRGKIIHFSEPDSIIVCENPDSFLSCISELDQAIQQGYYLAGYISYEAGWMFMGRRPAFRTKNFPLLWFGLYRTCAGGISLPDFKGSLPEVDWAPGISREEYDSRMRKIKDYIQAGDTYQVNYTFPFQASFSGDATQWFTALYQAQPTDHAAYLDLGRYKILSLSPELFFELEGDKLTTRPMKGTKQRGYCARLDDLARDGLHTSAKDRAENLMIVDLLRNDMGRISEIGSVKVERLFDLERYATIWQMTSTITSRTHASFGGILEALFPCGSVTGAPKLRTMEIIEEIETCRRGVYCGTIGWWGPDRRASFNVAIRTITLDMEHKTAVYPVGGGITWDSDIDSEYAECLSKAVGVSRPNPSFELLESLLFEGGYYLLEEHLDRLCSSAAYFDIPLRRETIREALLGAVSPSEATALKVRLLVDRRGSYRLESCPAPPVRTMRLALAAYPLSRENPFLYHKTTRRQHYDEAMALRPGFDDVLLWNEDGELMETTCANIVLNLDGKLLTPSEECGLLPGVMRRELLSQGAIQEARLPKSLLHSAREIFLINSVRKKIPALWCGEGD